MAEFINAPVRLTRRSERLGYHRDLQEGEQLIELATPEEVDDALRTMAMALREYYHDELPVSVVVYRAAEGTMARLQAIDSEFFNDLSAMAVKTTDGTERLPEPVVTERPRPQHIADRRVLVVDGVKDTGRTLRLCIDDINRQADEMKNTVQPPTEVKACVAVVKEGAEQYPVPELIACAMLATEADWVVGISNTSRGMDLDDRFAHQIPGLYHFEVSGAPTGYEDK